eukprot:TRINITY_DN1200_c0_g1_i1.p1 TRINITY_DN1200_c0_g1~~TRINITY_DN1200_c0_g1_i1.p1  ORF type:complete len:698 (-),score=259.36 TRINITY_DN1200_c0_g1_i1:214-2307(-)
MFSHSESYFAKLSHEKKITVELARSPENAFGLAVEKFMSLIPHDCPETFAELAFDCCEYESDDRPDFSAILQKCEQIMEQLQQQESEERDQEEEKRKLQDIAKQEELLAQAQRQEELIQAHLQREKQLEQEQEEKMTALKKYEESIKQKERELLLKLQEAELLQKQTEEQKKNILELQRLENERRITEKKEAELREVQRKESERLEAERKALERREAELRELEKREAERREAERKETEKREAERKEAERREAERRENEKKEAEKKEKEKREAERKEAEKKEAEKKESAKKLEAEKKAAEQSADSVVRRRPRLASLASTALGDGFENMTEEEKKKKRAEVVDNMMRQMGLREPNSPKSPLTSPTSASSNSPKEAHQNNNTKNEFDRFTMVIEADVKDNLHDQINKHDQKNLPAKPLPTSNTSNTSAPTKTDFQKASLTASSTMAWNQPDTNKERQIQRRESISGTKPVPKKDVHPATAAAGSPIPRKSSLAPIPKDTSTSSSSTSTHNDKAPPNPVHTHSAPELVSSGSNSRSSNKPKIRGKIPFTKKTLPVGRHNGEGKEKERNFDKWKKRKETTVENGGSSTASTKRMQTGPQWQGGFPSTPEQIEAYKEFMLKKYQQQQIADQIAAKNMEGGWQSGVVPGTIRGNKGQTERGEKIAKLLGSVKGEVEGISGSEVEKGEMLDLLQKLLVLNARITK